jgi:hypothetical protein
MATLDKIKQFVQNKTTRVVNPDLYSEYTSQLYKDALTATGGNTSVASQYVERVSRPTTTSGRSQTLPEPVIEQPIQQQPIQQQPVNDQTAAYQQLLDEMKAQNAAQIAGYQKNIQDVTSQYNQLQSQYDKAAQESLNRYNQLQGSFDAYKSDMGRQYDELLGAYGAYRDEVARKEAEQLAAQQELINRSIALGTDRLEAQRSGINLGYDDAARQAYIVEQQQQRSMPQQLAAQGMSGGATETAKLGLNTAYQNNINAINQNRAKAINDLDAAIVELKNTGDLQAAQNAINSAARSLQSYKDMFGMEQALKQNRIGAMANIVNTGIGLGQSAIANANQLAASRVGLAQDAIGMQSALNQGMLGLTSDQSQAYTNLMLQQLAAQKAAEDEARQHTLATMGAYSGDYQARINQLQNDGDPANDWQIPYLQTLRQDKIAGQKQDAIGTIGQYGADYQAQIDRINAEIAAGDRTNEYLLPYLQIARQQKLAAMAEGEKDIQAEAEKQFLNLAKLGAQYGDYSGLRELGINPVIKTASTRSGRSSGGSGTSSAAQGGLDKIVETLDAQGANWKAYLNVYYPQLGIKSAGAKDEVAKWYEDQLKSRETETKQAERNAYQALLKQANADMRQSNPIEDAREYVRRYNYITGK